jgi:CHRD domain
VRKLIALLAVGAVAALVFSALSSAKPRGGMHTVKATLNASQEIPKQAVANAAGKGSFAGTLEGSKLHWKLTFSGLTGPATAAHIHLGGMGKAGNVVVPLCAPCKSPMSGNATISASLWNKIEKHLTYVNVHTGKNPAGEIRGQLAATS